MRYLKCNDRERVLRSQDPEMLESFELHAAGCADCARELQMWNGISATAYSLRKSWDSPRLWLKIQSALEAEKEAKARPRGWHAIWDNSLRWARVPALASLLALMGVGAWIATHRPVSQPTTPEIQRRLLTELAVREVEKSEASYVDSIQKLSALAGPKIDSPQTPLLAAYREKLSVLDSAIDDCRAQVNHNPANPQLRQELLSMYREKQNTLQQVLREE